MAFALLGRVPHGPLYFDWLDFAYCGAQGLGCLALRQDRHSIFVWEDINWLITLQLRFLRREQFQCLVRFCVPSDSSLRKWRTDLYNNLKFSAKI